LEEYPAFNKEDFDEELLNEMEIVKAVCSIGLNIRDENKLKVRQPLSKAYIPILDPKMQEIVKGELNVKEVEYSKSLVEGEGISSLSNASVFVSLDIRVSEELKEEGVLNEILRGLQVARKESGCEVGELISLRYETQDEYISKLIEKYLESIKKSIYIKEIQKLQQIENGIQIKVRESVLGVEILKI